MRRALNWDRIAFVAAVILTLLSTSLVVHSACYRRCAGIGSGVTNLVGLQEKCKRYDDAEGPGGEALEYQRRVYIPANQGQDVEAEEDDSIKIRFYSCPVCYKECSTLYPAQSSPDEFPPNGEECTLGELINLWRCPAGK